MNFRSFEVALELFDLLDDTLETPSPKRPMGASGRKRIVRDSRPPANTDPKQSLVGWLRKGPIESVADLY